MGWAVIEGEPGVEPTYIDSGILGISRGDEKYQPYRLRLIEYWSQQADVLLYQYQPDFVGNEIIPPATGRAFKSNGVQSQLAATAITAIHTMAFRFKAEVTQMGATTIKQRIGGKGDATKVAVRNGVYSLIPELKDMKHHLWTKKEWHDESDACGAGLAILGYRA